MDKYIKLSLDALRYYLENGTYLREFDSEFKKKSNGIRVRIENKGRLKGEAGSIYPSKSNVGLDIVYESINAGFFDLTYNPITFDNIEDLDITIYEFCEVEKFRFIEEFDNFDGLMINFMDENYYVYRNDFDSDMAMLKKALRLANVDSWDNFSIDKFRVKVHR